MSKCNLIHVGHRWFAVADKLTGHRESRGASQARNAAWRQVNYKMAAVPEPIAMHEAQQNDEDEKLSVAGRDTKWTQLTDSIGAMLWLIATHEAQHNEG